MTAGHQLRVTHSSMSAWFTAPTNIVKTSTSRSHASTVHPFSAGATGRGRRARRGVAHADERAHPLSKRRTTASSSRRRAAPGRARRRAGRAATRRHDLGEPFRAGAPSAVRTRARRGPWRGPPSSSNAEELEAVEPRERCAPRGARRTSPGRRARCARGEPGASCARRRSSPPCRTAATKITHKDHANGPSTKKLRSRCAGCSSARSR